MGCFRLVYHGGGIISVRHCELTVSSQAKLLMHSHHAAVDNHASIEETVSQTPNVLIIL